MKAIILLSGGLDSLVSCGLMSESVELALTFDYGQKSAAKEILASKRICEHYGIKHEIVKLDFLKRITQTALVSDEQIPTLDADSLAQDEECKKTAKSVWVPNRNGLFLNIAASYCDSYGYEQIVIGANREEAQTFSDNTQEFIDRVNRAFEFSTQVHPKVVAPLINLDKNGIVKKALDEGIPLSYVQSCYSQSKKHCGVCESCQRLKRALSENECQKLIEEIFG